MHQPNFGTIAWAIPAGLAHEIRVAFVAGRARALRFRELGIRWIEPALDLFELVSVYANIGKTLLLERVQQFKAIQQKQLLGWQIL